MAASLKASGTWQTYTADGAVTIPGSPAAGDRMYVWVAWKPFGVTAQITSPQAWTEVTEYTDGAVADGNGVGSVKVACYYRDWQSGDGSPTIDFSAAVIALAVCEVWQKGAGDTWGTPTFVTQTLQANTAWSRTSSTSLTIEDNSVVFELVGFRDDVATHTRDSNTALDDDGSPAITWNGNVVESPATHGSTTTGNDLAADLIHRLVTTGAAGVNLTGTGSMAVGETGAILWVHQPVTIGAAPSITGTGGVAYSAALASVSVLGFPASGGVVFTASPAGVAQLKFIASGGVTFIGSKGAGSGTYTPLAITSSGGVVFTASLAGVGALVIPIIASGGVVFTVSPAGVAQLGFIASGGVTFIGSKGAGSGTILNPVIASGGVAFSASLSGVSLLRFIGSGGVSYVASISGTGLQVFPVVGTGGVSFVFGLSGLGSSVFGNDRVGVGAPFFSVSIGAAGLVLAPSGSSMTLIAAMIRYYEVYDLLSTEVARRELQADFIGRWGVYPVRIL